MSMRLMSEELLKREINRLEESEIPEGEKIIYHLCKKELAIIEKLKINNIDMRGGIEETITRIENQAIYFMNSQEFELIKEKARKYDEICRFINQ